MSSRRPRVSDASIGPILPFLKLLTINGKNTCPETTDDFLTTAAIGGPKRPHEETREKTTKKTTGNKPTWKTFCDLLKKENGLVTETPTACDDDNNLTTENQARCMWALNKQKFFEYYKEENKAWYEFYGTDNLLTNLGDTQDKYIYYYQARTPESPIVTAYVDVLKKTTTFFPLLPDASKVEAPNGVTPHWQQKSNYEPLKDYLQKQNNDPNIHKLVEILDNISYAAADTGNSAADTTNSAADGSQLVDVGNLDVKWKIKGPIHPLSNVVFAQFAMVIENDEYLKTGGQNILDKLKTQHFKPDDYLKTEIYKWVRETSNMFDPKSLPVGWIAFKKLRNDVWNTLQNIQSATSKKCGPKFFETKYIGPRFGQNNGRAISNASSPKYAWLIYLGLIKSENKNANARNREDNREDNRDANCEDNQHGGYDALYDLLLRK